MDRVFHVKSFGLFWWRSKLALGAKEVWVFKIRAIVTGLDMTVPQARESIAWRLDRGQFFEVLQDLASAGGYVVCLCAGHP